MPVYLFTYYAPGPLDEEGEPRFTLRNTPPRPDRLPLAERYRLKVEDREVCFDANHRRKLMDLVMDSQRQEKHRCFGVAAGETRLHALVAWTTDRTAADLRAAIRATLVRGMNREFGRNRWLGDGGDMKRVRNRTQFDYLLSSCLPKSEKLAWTATRGIASPLAATA